jgi:hypothetical protein
MSRGCLFSKATNARLVSTTNEAILELSISHIVLTKGSSFVLTTTADERNVIIVDGLSSHSAFAFQITNEDA